MGIYHSAPVCETPLRTSPLALIVVSDIRQKNVRQKNKKRHCSVLHFSVWLVVLADKTIKVSPRNSRLPAADRERCGLCYHSRRNEGSLPTFPVASLVNRLRRRGRGDGVTVRRQLPAGRGTALSIRALGLGSSRAIRRRLGAPSLHFRLRLSGPDRLSRRAAVDGLDLPGDRASDVAAGRGFRDQPRAACDRAHLAAAIVLPFLR